MLPSLLIFFFFNDTATTEIYTLSLHDALPIFDVARDHAIDQTGGIFAADDVLVQRDRKSTRLNSSHSQISYAVFCLKKKKKKTKMAIDTTIIISMSQHRFITVPHLPLSLHGTL